MRGGAIRVEAPNALLGFMLALRLRDLDADVVRTPGGRWAVEVPAGAPSARVLSAVQAWLDDEALDRVTVQLGGKRYTMTGQRPLRQRDDVSAGASSSPASSRRNFA